MSCDYQKTANGVAEKLQEYYRNTDGWTVSNKSTKQFKISYKSSVEFDGYLYKGEVELNAKPEAVFRYVEPLPEGERSKWDKNMKKIEVVRKIDDKIRINRACTDSACMGIISPRDFVDLIIVKETDEYISTNAVSIECQDCCPVDTHVRGHNYNCAMSIKDEYEEQKKFVRGWNYQCGIIVVKIPNEPNKCKLVSLIQPDIRGKVPRSLADSAIPGSMCEFFQQLRDALKKGGELPPDDE